MSESMVLDIIKDAIVTSLMVAGPFLVIALVLGLIISIIQATTQIQEQTLTFVPKLIGVAVVGLLLGSWMFHKLLDFTQRIFQIIANITQ